MSAWPPASLLPLPSAVPVQPVTGLTLAQSGERYLEACRLRGFSGTTLKSYAQGLRYFQQWCEARELRHPEQLTPLLLNRYRRAVFYLHNKHGTPLKQRSQAKYLTPVRSLFAWLAAQRILAFDPAASLEMPRVRQELPKHLLTPKEVEAVMAQVDITAPLGLRDRALLEVVYSTGLRRSELAALQLPDVNLESGWVMVVQGKGGKDRRIPIGTRACLWLAKYLHDQRPYLLGSHTHPHVFVYANGKPMSEDKIYRCIHGYIEAAQLGKQGGVHMLRHAMATHMLEGGADIRYIQAMLGHEKLTSTQIYTRVQDNKLKDVHSRTHPAGVKKKTPDVSGGEDT